MSTQAAGAARTEADAPLGTAFWKVWCASTAVNLGDGIRLVALPLLATRLTSDPALIALVTVVTFLPAVVFGSLAGVLVDRVDRRRAMLAANSGRALVLLVLVALIANDLVTMPWLLLFALLYGIGEVIADPAAHAYLPRIVAPQQLGRANSKIFTGQIVAEDFIGRALGGVLFAGAAFLPFAGNAAVLVLAALLIATVPSDRSTPPAETGGTPSQRVWTDLRKGLQFVFSSPLLRGMSLLLGAWAATAGAFWGVAVVYATSELGASASAFGIFLAVSAVGALVGASVATRLLGRWGAFPTVLVSLAASTVAITCLGIAPNLAVATVLLAINGVATTCWNVLSVTVRQRSVPNRLLGRVASTYRLLATVSMPLGAGLAGLLASAFGTRIVFLACGALLVTAGGLLLPGLRSPITAAWPRDTAPTPTGH